MKHESFCGIAGGLPGEAIYILGHYDESLILLDPHYVQKADEGRYFKKTPRGISIQKICPTFAFCYYFKDETTYMDWVTWIIHSKMLY